MWTFIDFGALFSLFILYKTFKKVKQAYLYKNLKLFKNSRKEYRGYTLIDADIIQKDVAKCKSSYFGYLASFEETPNTLFIAFLFESLESRRISITQEIIDNIRYINSKSGL